MFSNSISIVIILGIIFRIYVILPVTSSPRRNLRRKSECCSFAVFLGSGGHTTEALALMSGLDFSRYTPRTYITSQGDILSLQKVSTFEMSRNPSSANRNAYSILTIPRARRVHQSLLSTLPNAVLSLVACIYYVVISPLFRKGQPILAEVLLVNGPGTCVILCAAVYLNKFLGLPASQIIYIESFARVKSLSFSGRLLRPFVDRFVVQWKELLQDGGRGEYHRSLLGKHIV